jgi:phosphoribosylanthranilate isomerase
MLDRDKGATAGSAEQSRLWKLAREIRDYGPLILAGGLTPESVGQAIETARPYAVDVSSGVESEPGKKDHVKLRAFIAATKYVQTGANVETTG